MFPPIYFLSKKGKMERKHLDNLYSRLIQHFPRLLIQWDRFSRELSSRPFVWIPSSSGDTGRAFLPYEEGRASSIRRESGTSSSKSGRFCCRNLPQRQRRIGGRNRLKNVGRFTHLSRQPRPYYCHHSFQSLILNGKMLDYSQSYSEHTRGNGKPAQVTLKQYQKRFRLKGPYDSQHYNRVLTFQLDSLSVHVLVCVSIWHFCLNPLMQWGHWKGRSPVWIRICVLSL